MKSSPEMTQNDIYTAREGGYWNYRIPCLAVTASGTILAAAEARPVHGGDYDLNDLILRRSLDGGTTFESPIVLVQSQEYGEGPAHNLVLITDRAGKWVRALFCHDYNRAFTMVSHDDGVTFSNPVEITAVLGQFQHGYPWRVCATGPGHGLQLRNGRLVVPVWLSDGSGSEFGPRHRGHRPSVVSSIYSDNDGLNWHCGDILCRDGDLLDGVVVTNPSETAAVELSDGRVMFNLRNDSSPRRRLVAVSPDGVSSWKLVRFDPILLEPACMASMIRLNWVQINFPGRILFANPASLENEHIPAGTIFAHDRVRLTVRLSLDDGETWSISRVLEPGPSGYSDLGCLSDGSILCLYECGMVNHIFDPRSLRLARFDLAWMENR